MSTMPPQPPGPSALPDGAVTDEELVSRCREGDPEAFDDLVRAHQERVYNIAYRMVGNADDAADLAQEAFLRVCHALRNFRGDSSFSTWMYRIVANVCLDEIKRRQVKRRTEVSARREDDEADSDPVDRLVDDSGRPDAVVQRRERQDAVQRALLELPEHQRAVLVLYDIEGWSYEEIAELLDVSLGTVKSRINRGRLALKSKLAPELELFGMPARQTESSSRTIEESPS